MANDRTVSIAELVRMLQRAGYSDDRIKEIAAQLHDPVDFNAEQELLLRYGLTRDRLMDLMGGSP